MTRSSWVGLLRFPGIAQKWQREFRKWPNHKTHLFASHLSASLSHPCDSLSISPHQQLTSDLCRQPSRGKGGGEGRRQNTASHSIKKFLFPTSQRAHIHRQYYYPPCAAQRCPLTRPAMECDLKDGQCVYAERETGEGVTLRWRHVHYWGPWENVPTGTVTRETTTTTEKRLWESRGGVVQ